MYKHATAGLFLGALVAAAPAPQLPTFSAATAPIAPVVSSQVTGATSHGPFSGEATVTGAISRGVPTAQTIAPIPAPSPSYINTNGELQLDQPLAYQPAGGAETDGTIPYYHPLSDFDYESFTLALYQEWIELDLFHWGLATFSEAEFDAAGINAEYRSLIEFMANQEVGHSTLLTNILGEGAPIQCTYDYSSVTTVREFVDFCQRLTRFGESGVYGFLGHLDSRAASALLLQSITTEARQQMVFRQFLGMQPMPVWFEVGIPQSWAWTLLAPYISECPANNTRLAWQNFPTLTILNNPNPNAIDPQIGANDTSNSTPGADNVPSTNVANNSCVNATAVGENCSAAVSHNRTNPLSYPGRPIYLSWGEADQPIGPNNSYVTSRSPVADAPRFAMFVNQLNATFVPLMNISGNTGVAIQPNTSTFAGDPTVNGTSFIAITSQDVYVTPFNLSNINPFVYAGPALYSSG